MKKNVSKRVLSAFLAVVMVFLMVPFAAITIFSEEVTLPQIDYTPFLIESVNGQGIYNSQTADLSYDFYKAAKAYVDDNASSTIKSIKDGEFSFSHKGVSYTLNSVYINKPTGFWDSTCGMLIGVFSYAFENTTNHIMMVMFEGTKGKWDVLTDLSFAPQKVDSNHWYHNGFYEAAHNHYNILSEQKFDLGNEEVTLLEYIDKLKSDDSNYQMLITGHSLGAATANIFASYFIDTLGGYEVRKNVAAYTFATPLTCSDGTANNSTIKNVFNYINKWDWVPKVGYGGVEALDIGAREGIDFKFTAGSSDWKDKQPIFGKKFLNFTNHKMSSSVYGTILEQVNNSICDVKINPYGAYVLYNNYDSSTHTHQRIVYNNGQLIVSGSGILAGNWTENTLVEWAKVKDSCTSLVFDADCAITEIGDYAFAGMSQLNNELDLPETLNKIGNYAFFYCGITGELELHGGVESVGSNAFYGCSFSRVDLSNLDLNQFYWGLNAFKGCVSPDCLVLPMGSELTQDISEFGFRYYYEKGGRIASVTVNNGTTSNPNLTGESYKIESGSRVYCRTLDERKLESKTLDFAFLITIVDTTVIGTPEQYYTNYNDWIIVDPNTGVVEITDACPEINFRIGAYHKKADGTAAYGTRHYYMDFEVTANQTNFAGGFGTKDRPFLISNKQQLAKIVGEENKGVYFELTTNIDYQDSKISCLGNFYGYLNGNGYSIFGFTIDTGSDSRLGLFNEIIEGATISNLTVGAVGCTTSVTINAFSGLTVYGGILASKNSGIIENCCAKSAKVVAYVNTSNDGETKYSRAGGLVGENVGTIKYCGSIACQIEAKAYSKNDGQFGNHKNAYAWAGGLVGKNSGVISYCYSYENTITANTEANSCGTDDAYGYSHAGGLVGEQSSGNISYAITCDKNTLNPTGSTNRTNIFPVGKGDAEIYKYSDTLVSANKPSEVTHIHLEDTYTLDAITDENILNEFSQYFINTITYPLPQKSNISFIDIIEPNKTTYYVGEALNLYGLVVTDNNDNLINNYTISGFDINKLGTQAITVTCVNGYGIFSNTFNVTVENIIPEKIVVQPKEPSYYLNETLSLNDFFAQIYYNNGAVESLESLDNTNASRVAFVPFVNTLTKINKQVIDLICGYSNGINTSYVTVEVSVSVNCDCLSTTTLNAIPATVTEYGYTGDIVCSTCQSIVEEGSLIDMLECTDHNFDAWLEYDNTQHSRTCSVCGEVEYQAHNWDDDSTITKPATHLEAGELTKVCTDCGATKTETIPPISTHTFGDWQPFSDSQHYRTCACDETEYAAHHWDDGVVTLEPTYTTEGIRTYTCEDCGATETEMIPIVQPDYIPGDINGDGIVNTKDTTRLMRYLAGWNVEVNEAALDVNGDGVVNTKDTTRLMRYLAGWDVEIY